MTKWLFAAPLAAIGFACLAALVGVLLEPMPGDGLDRALTAAFLFGVAAGCAYGVAAVLGSARGKA